MPLKKLDIFSDYRVHEVSPGAITPTGSAPGTVGYVENTRIKCFE